MAFSEDTCRDRTGDEPCRNIKSRDLLKCLGRRKITRKMGYPFAMLLEKLYGIIFVDLKRDNAVGMEFPGKPSRNESRRAAEKD